MKLRPRRRGRVGMQGIGTISLQHSLSSERSSVAGSPALLIRRNFQCRCARVGRGGVRLESFSSSASACWSCLVAELEERARMRCHPYVPVSLHAGTLGDPSEENQTKNAVLNALDELIEL